MKVHFGTSHTFALCLETIWKLFNLTSRDKGKIKQGKAKCTVNTFCVFFIPIYVRLQLTFTQKIKR